MRPEQPDPMRSMVWATDIDVLPDDRVLERHVDHWVVRSPSNPQHWWGNFLVFDAPPAAGDGARWERSFTTAFAGTPAVSHRAFAWDCVDGDPGAADREFVRRGYELERTVGLIARPAELTPHARENREIEVRALDPAPGRDSALWEQVVELQVAGYKAALESADAYRVFARGRQNDLRKLFRLGRGGWWVALTRDGTVAGSLGVVVTGSRARYQTVDTALPYRRRGISSRLVVEAAASTAREHAVESFVIAADADYHALGLYESLGFRRCEAVCGVLLPAGRVGAVDGAGPAGSS